MASGLPDSPSRILQRIARDHWTPAERATLLFVVRDGQVLLMHKKRGIGAGKVNAPGGRIDPGESPLEAAVREMEEEVGVTPVGVSAVGELRFQFTDGHSILCHVFRAADCRGEPVETEEAAPFWVPVDAIPFDRMWQDDRLWLPLLLAGERFAGCAVFDGEEMLAHEVRRVGGKELGG